MLQKLSEISLVNRGHLIRMTTLRPSGWRNLGKPCQQGRGLASQNTAHIICQESEMAGYVLYLCNLKLKLFV